MYFAIVTFGSETYGRRRSFYRNKARAIADARTLGGGSLSTVRVLECPDRATAIDADISDSNLPAVWVS